MLARAHAPSPACCALALQTRLAGARLPRLIEQSHSTCCHDCQVREQRCLLSCQGPRLERSECCSSRPHDTRNADARESTLTALAWLRQYRFSNSIDPCDVRGRAACAMSSGGHGSLFSVNIRRAPRRRGHVADLLVRRCRNHDTVRDDDAPVLIATLALGRDVDRVLEEAVHQYLSPQVSRGPSIPEVSGTAQPSVVVMHSCTTFMTSGASARVACNTISSCTGTMRFSVRSA